MFCSNCGKQIPENTKFCNYCGAQQPASNSAANAPISAAAEQQNQAASPKQKEKKPLNMKNIVIVLAASLCAFLLGKFVLAPAMRSDPKEKPAPDRLVSQTQPSSEESGGASTDTPNPAYEAVLTDACIVHFQSFFNMETASFVTVQEQGIIFCSDYGYQDDVVHQLVETMYVPISGYTDEQKAQLESTMKETYDAAVEEIGCVTVSYNMGTNYFSVTLEYKNLNLAENYGALYDAGIIDTNTCISMTITEKQLLAEGAIKK